MEKSYFKITNEEGNIYCQTRFRSPYESDKAYEVIIILVNNSGEAKEFIEYFNETDFNYLDKNSQDLTESEFNSLQEENFLGGKGKRAELYNNYYNTWKEYLVPKRELLNRVRGSATKSNFSYREIEQLDRESRINGIYDKKDSALRLRDSVKQDKVNAFDVYEEAYRHVIRDYVANKF